MQTVTNQINWVDKCELIVYLQGNSMTLKRKVPLNTYTIIWSGKYYTGLRSYIIFSVKQT